MRAVAADTQTWLAARQLLLDRCDDFYLQLARAGESFDPEAIHDLRVSSRRLREGIAIFSACFGKRRLAPIRKELKELTGMLGSIRNSDEAIIFFSPLAEKCDSGDRAIVKSIIATLQERRDDELRRLKRALKKIDPGSLLGRIDNICSNPRIFKPANGTLFQPVATTILEAVAVREKTMLELLPEALIEENVTPQHRLRIAVKRFRYRMEFLANIAKGDYRSVYSSIKEYQEILGHMHDLDVFIGLVSAPSDVPEKNSSLKRVITGRRRELFHELLGLHESAPLYELGDRVRGLL